MLRLSIIEIATPSWASLVRLKVTGDCGPCDQQDAKLLISASSSLTKYGSYLFILIMYVCICVCVCAFSVTSSNTACCNGPYQRKIEDNGIYRLNFPEACSVLDSRLPLGNHTANLPTDCLSDIFISEFKLHHFSGYNKIQKVQMAKIQKIKFEMFILKI